LKQRIDPLSLSVGAPNWALGEFAWAVFNSKELTEITSPDFYDYIVIDEFHHAAAPSYQELLGYFRPKILLGLTAIPERADGRSIYSYSRAGLLPKSDYGKRLNENCSVPFIILVAFGKHTETKKSAFREGVLYLSEKKLDVFFVTLNKSEKDYSPSTMYQDYSINEELFHWQSQSRTTEESVTGQRYINQSANGGNVLFFCEGIQRRGKIHITLYLSWVGRFSKSLWFSTDQYCVEDEGFVARVCDEEDGEGLTRSYRRYIRTRCLAR